MEKQEVGSGSQRETGGPKCCMQCNGIYEQAIFRNRCLSDIKASSEKALGQ